MKVSPATLIKAGKNYRFKSKRFVSGSNCKFFYVPKELYKQSLARIKEKQQQSVITDFLIIPYGNYDGAIVIINYS